jgi:hypothetical protein
MFHTHTKQRGCILTFTILYKSREARDSELDGVSVLRIKFSCKSL